MFRVHLQFNYHAKIYHRKTMNGWISLACDSWTVVEIEMICSPVRQLASQVCGLAAAGDCNCVCCRRRFDWRRGRCLLSVAWAEGLSG